ncbi:MAG TPA: DUF2007 domain-containing protein [Promineifilum sp.]|nr:DUF2007 domain-containing protein [Promineifilum sp.]
MPKDESIDVPGPVAVGWYLHPMEAHIAKGLLESEGIPAYLDTINHATTNWPLTLALGGIRLLVPKSEAARATELLASTVPIEDDVVEESCPSCVSNRTVPVKWNWKLSLFSSNVLGVPLPFTRKWRRCLDCGLTWKDTT